MRASERIPQRIGLHVVIVRAVKEERDVERLGAGHQRIAHQRAPLPQRRGAARHTSPWGIGSTHLRLIVCFLRHGITGSIPDPPPLERCTDHCLAGVYLGR